jgi:hypothetical protein
VVYRNRAALPRAYLAGAVEVLDGEAAIERLLSEDFDARNTVILPEPLPADVEVRQGVAGAVEWIEREVDRFTLRVAPDGPALLVVLDNWFPAWEATVNGHIVPVYRANHTFRAVAVPPGEHTVVFRYTPADLRAGSASRSSPSALLLACLRWLAGRHRGIGGHARPGHDRSHGVRRR